MPCKQLDWHLSNIQYNLWHCVFLINPRFSDYTMGKRIPDEASKLWDEDRQDQKRMKDVSRHKHQVPEASSRT